MQEIVLTLLLTRDEWQALRENNQTRGWGHFMGPLTVIDCDDDDDQDDV
jgi:hypothetical protein